MRNQSCSYLIKRERELSDQVKAEVRRLKSDFLSDYVTQNLENGNSKPLFAHIKRSRGQSSHINRLKDTENDKIAAKLAEHFSRVYNHHSYANPEFPCKSMSDMPAIAISASGVKSYLCSLDPRKSTGPDDISPAVLKNFATNVPSFVKCLTSRAFVSEMCRKAEVSPIYKGGPREEVNKYRPVSITSILCKCLEHIICSSIRRHIVQNDLLSDRQQ